MSETIKDLLTVPDASHVSVRLQMEMPGEVASVQSVRRAARGFLKSGAVSDEDAGDVELILGELTTNALRHAPQGGRFTTELELSADAATVSVTDEGEGFSHDPQATSGTVRPEILDNAAEERIGGFGLMLVRAVADSVTIDNHVNDGTTVSAKKTLHPSPPITEADAKPA